MPVPVGKIPNPWEPYMDGRIWAFTLEEYNKMPSWVPWTNQIRSVGMGESVGPTYWITTLYDMMYIQFFNTEHMEMTLRQLTGWNND